MGRGLLAGSILLACGGAREPSRPLVLVSVRPQAFFVERIAGPLLEVEAMIPAGANPVTFEPGFEQLRALSRADLYVKVGHPHFPFEAAWLDPLLADHPHLLVVNGSAELEPLGEDPHVWLVPRRARRMARTVASALARRFPEHAASFEANLETLRGEIDRVDQEIRRTLEGKTGGTFLVFHPAWGAFAEEYGLEQLAIEQDQKEPDPRQLAERLEAARAAGIEVLFVQPQFHRANAEWVAREIGARVETLDPLAYDWSRTLRETAHRLARAMKK